MSEGNKSLTMTSPLPDSSPVDKSQTLIILAKLPQSGRHHLDKIAADRSKAVVTSRFDVTMFDTCNSMWSPFTVFFRAN